MTRRSSLLALDVVVVVAFVVIGRRSHDEAESVTGVLATSAPFLLALLAGWGIALAWKDPGSLRTGGVTLATTLVGGMLLRRFAFSDGTAVTFVLVATVFLSLGMLGWRALWRTLEDRSRTASPVA